MREELQQRRFGGRRLEARGRGEAAQERNRRLRRKAWEGERPRRLREHDPALRLLVGARVRRLERELVSGLVEERQSDRDFERELLLLARSRRRRLREGQGEDARLRVVARRDLDDGRARLRIPARELRKIALGALRETGEEILDRRRRAVKAREIEIHPASEGLRADQRLQHAHDLGALLVDGRGVKIVDRPIGVGAHGMGERACILDELREAQRSDVVDALDGARAHVGGKLLVAIDGQAFLEAELEPVAAGDAIAGPIVKIFMRDDALDAGVIRVGRGLRRGQHIFVVEDVEALVLHRAHVEVGDGDDVEDVEIIFAAEDLLVPAHGAHERVHRIFRARLLAVLDEDRELHLAAGARREIARDRAEVATDEREEIAGLRIGIAPDRKVAAAFERDLLR